jgi:hypothetical protein
MALHLQDVARWSYARLFGGLTPIRIAVPAWRVSRPVHAAKKPAVRVSQDEMLRLFQGELRSMTQTTVQSKTNAAVSSTADAA